MNVRKIRDLTVIEITEEKFMIIACDSCGSIGSKEMDELKVHPFFVGKFTGRVVLMEILASGAEVVTISNAVCCEMNPTGKEIIRGLKQEMLKAGIDDIVLTGSTEENFNTFSTAVGITAIGIVDKKFTRINNIVRDCKLISIGIPKVGAEIGLEKDDDIFSYEDLKFLINCSDVYEIVPVGSKGILFEAETLASNNNLKLYMKEKVVVDINKTCGPATVAVAAVADFKLKYIMENIKNVNLIGDLKVKTI